MSKEIDKYNSCLLKNLHCGECDGGCDENFSAYIKDPRLENNQLKELLKNCLAIFDAEPNDATIAIPQVRKDIMKVFVGEPDE